MFTVWWGSGLEDDLVPSRDEPWSTTPALGRQRRGATTAHAPADKDLEIGECHAPALLLPDRAKREDRVEGVVGIHGYVVRRSAELDVSVASRSIADDNAQDMPQGLRRR